MILHSKVLIIDNDKTTQTVVRDFLESEGYTVFVSDSGYKLETIIELNDPDIVLLDIVLPNKDGLTLIPRIKNKTPNPLIIISEKDETVDQIVALELGADAFVGKPLNTKELATQVKALLRLSVRLKEKALERETNAYDKQQKDILQFGPWTLNRKKLELINGSGDVVDISIGEFKLLEALALSPNQALSRALLIDLVKEDTPHLSDRAIDMQIARIRKKIEKNPRKPKYIKTIRGIGYMLDVE